MFFRIVFVFSSFLFPWKLTADTVEVWNPTSERGFLEISGEILEVNRHVLKIRTETEPQRKVSYEKVRKMMWEKSPQWQQGDFAFQRKEYANALECYRREFSQEEKRWKQVELKVQMIRCLTRMGAHPQALEKGLQLLRLEPDLTDEHYAVLPFLWKPNIADTASETVAVRWMKQKVSPDEILLCGSYLLSSARRGEIVNRFQLLSQAKDGRLAGVAKIQLWRTERLDVTAVGIERWEEELAQIPEPLRGGGFFLLGEAWFQCEEWDRAALAYLEMLLCYPETACRLPETFRQTATALEKGGHPDETLLLQKMQEKGY